MKQNNIRLYWGEWKLSPQFLWDWPWWRPPWPWCARRWSWHRRSSCAWRGCTGCGQRAGSDPGTGGETRDHRHPPGTRAPSSRGHGAGSVTTWGHQFPFPTPGGCQGCSREDDTHPGREAGEHHREDNSDCKDGTGSMLVLSELLQWLPAIPGGFTRRGTQRESDTIAEFYDLERLWY